MKRISIVSLKNGMGCSTTTLNLSYLFYQLGLKVCILDLDVYFSDSSRILAGESFFESSIKIEQTNLIEIMLHADEKNLIKTVSLCQIEIEKQSRQSTSNIPANDDQSQLDKDTNNVETEINGNEPLQDEDTNSAETKEESPKVTENVDKNRIISEIKNESSITLIPFHFCEPENNWELDEHLDNDKIDKILASFQIFLQNVDADILLFDTSGKWDFYTQLALKNTDLCLVLTYQNRDYRKKTNQYINFLEKQYDCKFVLTSQMLPIKHFIDLSQNLSIPFNEELAQFYLSQTMEPFYIKKVLQKITEDKLTSTIKAQEKYYMASLFWIMRNILIKTDSWTKERHEHYIKWIKTLLEKHDEAIFCDLLKDFDK